MAGRRTLAIIKPDAMESRLAGKIISRIELAGFTIVEMRLLRMSLPDAGELYSEHDGKPFFIELCAFMCSRPVIVMVLDRADAVTAWREILGPTDPRVAHDHDVSRGTLTLRGSWGDRSGVIWRNVAHGSGSDDDAGREIDLFFGDYGRASG